MFILAHDFRGPSPGWLGELFWTCGEAEHHIREHGGAELLAPLQLGSREDERAKEEGVGDKILVICFLHLDLTF